MKRLVLPILLCALAACGGAAALYGQIQTEAGPLAAASVSLINPTTKQTQQTVKTDAAGKFAFKGAVTPGAYVVEVQAAGFKAERKTVTYPEQTALEFSLTKLRKLHGVLKLPDGSVADKAKISFQREGVKLEATAGDDGSYSIEGIEPGKWVVFVANKQGEQSYQDAQTIGSEQDITLDITLGAQKIQASGAGEAGRGNSNGDPTGPISN